MKFPTGIRKCKRPTRRNVRGRTWDQCEVTLPDGSPTLGHYDTTWGRRFYFEHEGHWYCGSIADFDTGRSQLLITPDLLRVAFRDAGRDCAKWLHRNEGGTGR